MHASASLRSINTNYTQFAAVFLRVEKKIFKEIMHFALHDQFVTDEKFECLTYQQYLHYCVIFENTLNPD